MERSIDGGLMMGSAVRFEHTPACPYCGRLILVCHPENPPVMTGDFSEPNIDKRQYIMVHANCRVPFYKACEADIEAFEAAQA